MKGVALLLGNVFHSWYQNHFCLDYIHVRRKSNANVVAIFRSYNVSFEAKKKIFLIHVKKRGKKLGLVTNLTIE